MKKYIAKVNMTNRVQVEFEMPDDCDQSTVEIQAIIEAEEKWGEVDHIEVIEVKDAK